MKGGKEIHQVEVLESLWFSLFLALGLCQYRNYSVKWVQRCLVGTTAGDKDQPGSPWTETNTLLCDFV